MRDRQWLLIKHRDQHASSTVDLTLAKRSPVVSRRTMAGIARAAGPVRASAEQAVGADPARSATRPAWSGRARRRRPPMLATLVDAPFHTPGWVYEEKYDGIASSPPRTVCTSSWSHAT